MSDQPEKRVETSRVLTAEVFNQMKALSRKDRRVINKECFYFRMEDGEDVFIYKIENFNLPEGHFGVLHLTSNKEKKQRKAPNFLEVVKEVTDDSKFFTHKLAKSKLVGLKDMLERIESF